LAVLLPNSRSKKPPRSPASAAARYCGPQPWSPSAIKSDWRCAARSAVLPDRRSRSFCMRSSIDRCRSISRASGPHWRGGLLNIEKKLELSHPMRRDCDTRRSTSYCWRLTASSARRICSARAGSLLPRSSAASCASRAWQAGAGPGAGACAEANVAAVSRAAARAVRARAGCVMRLL